MRLRLAVVAVALLVSFGVRARDFDISGNEYIGNIIREFHEGVLVAECKKSNEDGNDQCIYRVNNSEGIRITVNANTGKMQYMGLFCIHETCTLAKLIGILMETSPMLSKYIMGWNDMESWEQLIKKGKENKSRLLLRRNANLEVSIFRQRDLPGIQVYIALPEVQ